MPHPSKHGTGVFLGCLASGEQTFDDVPSHLEGHPHAANLVPDALARISSRGRATIYDEVDFQRIIGSSNCVPTTAADEIVFAQRKKRAGLTRFVKHRLPIPSSVVTVALERVDEQTYVVRTAYIGRKTPAEPWDHKYATEESAPFWSRHALVWGTSEIVADPDADVGSGQPLTDRS